MPQMAEQGKTLFIPKSSKMDLITGDGYDIHHEFQGENSPFKCELEFDEDFSVSLAATAGLTELSVGYRAEDWGDHNTPSIITSISFQPNREVARSQGRECERNYQDGLMQKDEYWEAVKKLSLYTRMHLVEALKEKGSEVVFVQGQPVKASYDSEKGMFGIEFPHDGKMTTFTIPESVGVIRELKNRHFPLEPMRLYSGAYETLIPVSPLDMLGITLV